MKIYHILLSAFLAVVCGLHVCAEEPKPIRVLTFNILCAGWEGEPKNEHVWEKRLPLVIDVMKNGTDGNEPYDFIGTQETNNNPLYIKGHQVKHLADAMTDYHSLYVPTDERILKQSLTNMIFFRKGRWEMEWSDSGAFWLSSTPDVPGSNDWGKENPAGLKRNVTYGLFHEIGANGRTGRKVYFFNTHLNAMVEHARFRSVLLIMEKIANRKVKDAPVIVTGDFNLRQNSPPIEYLQGKPFEFDGKKYTPPFSLIDTFKAVHPDLQADVNYCNEKMKLLEKMVASEFEAIKTRENLRFAEKKWDMKIDFIFVNDQLKPIDSKVILTQKDGLYPSDHLPVEAVLEWKK